MGLGDIMREGSWKALVRCTPWRSHKNVLQDDHSDDEPPCINREYSGASTVSGAKSPPGSFKAPMAVCVAIPMGKAAALHLPVAKAVVVMATSLSEWLDELDRPDDSILLSAIEERNRDLRARPPIPAEEDQGSSSRASMDPSADDSVDEFFASPHHHGASWRPSAPQQAHEAQASSHTPPDGGMPESRGEESLWSVMGAGKGDGVSAQDGGGIHTAEVVILDDHA